METFEASKFDFNWAEVAGVIGLGLLGMELRKQGRQVSTSQQEVVPLTSIEGNESPEILARESQSADFSPALGSENFQGDMESNLWSSCALCAWMHLRTVSLILVAIAAHVTPVA